MRYNKIVTIKIAINKASNQIVIFVFLSITRFLLLNSPIKMFAKKVKTFNPDAKNHLLYKKYYTIYKSLYEKLKDSFDELLVMNRE